MDQERIGPERYGEEDGTERSSTSNNPGQPFVHGDHVEEHLLAESEESDGSLNSLRLHVRSCPTDPEAWYALGAAAAEAGSWTIAEDALQQAIALGRDDATTRAGLASVLQLMGQHARAVEQATLALEMNPDPKVRAWLDGLLGACYGVLDDTEGALVHLQQSVERNPEQMEAQHNLGVAYLQRGHYIAAVHHLERAAALAPEVATNWLDLGSAYLGKGDLLAARVALEKAISHGLDNSRSHSEFALVLSQLEEFDAAVEHASRALRWAESASDRSLMHQVLAISHANLGDPEAELQHALLATESDPADAGAQLRLGIAYLDQSQFEQALKSLERAVLLDPQGFEASRQLILTFKALGRWTDAISEAGRAIELVSDSECVGWLHSTMAYCYAQLERPEEELQHLRAAGEVNPRDSVAQHNLGQFYRRLGEHQEAVKYLRQATVLDPSDTGFALALAEAYADTGRVEEAEALFHSLLGSDQHTGAFINLVLCEVDRGDVGSALQRALKEVRRVPNSAAAWIAYSLALEKSGEHSESREALDRARALDPAEPWLLCLSDADPD